MKIKNISNIVFKVSKDDIYGGTRYNGRSCPVARCIRRIAKYTHKKTIHVASSAIIIGNDEYKTPLNVSRFIDRFDDDNNWDCDKGCSTLRGISFKLNK